MEIGEHSVFEYSVSGPTALAAPVIEFGTAGPSRFEVEEASKCILTYSFAFDGSPLLMLKEIFRRNDSTLDGSTTSTGPYHDG